MIKVLIDTSPLASASAIRGIGVYTRFLVEYLEKSNLVEVQRSTTQKNDFKPDIIHYPFFDFFFATLPIFRKAKTIVTLHDCIPLRFLEYNKPGIRGLLNLIRQSLLLRSVQGIITDSQSSKADIQHFLKIKDEKIYPIYLAANPEVKGVTPALQNSIRKKYSLPKTYLLYVGDINYNKNLPSLIKSLIHLPWNIKLVLVGKNFIQSNIKEWKWIEAQIAASQVQNRVVFVNDIQSEASDDLAAIYAGALAYVQPSFFEGFGLPVLEAMQCLTPVIAANNSSLTEISKGAAILIKPTADEIAKAVETIMSWQEIEKTRILEAAFRHSQKFTWEKVAADTIQVYKNILANK